MSISKFSKDVLMVFPSHKQILELDVAEKSKAISSVEKVIQRLNILGITEAHLMADNSLAVEGYDMLRKTDINVNVYDVLPPVQKELILKRMIGDDEERNKLIEGTFPKIHEPFNKNELIEVEKNIMTIVNSSFSDLMQSVSVPHEEKVKVILMVMALAYFKLDFDEKDLMNYDAELVTFLHSTMKTQEEMVEIIENNFDYYWDWSNEILERNRSKNSTYSLFADLNSINSKSYDDGFDELEIQTQEIMSVLDALEYGKNKPSMQVKSELLLRVNKDSIKSRIESRDAEIQSSLTEQEEVPTLSEAFNNMSNYEINNNAELRTQMNLLIKEVEQYMILNAKALKHKYNLIINFFVSQNNRLFKSMDITGENKILLNVDLKTGYADVLFRGQPFKINGFFLQGEEVKVNTLEW